MSPEPKPALSLDAGASEPDTVEHEDVDDVVGIAAELQADAEDDLSIDDLKAMGPELGLEPKHLERAVAVLEDRRAEESEQLAEQTARRKKLFTLVAIALSAVLGLSSIVAFSVQAGLRDDLAAVERTRAQVQNVTERQARTEALYRDAAPSLDREAELNGAENRVRVERKRYDEAAVEYNRSVSGPLGGPVATLFGLPARVPLSNEVR